MLPFLRLLLATARHLHTIQELNIGLEQKVEERAQALSEKNRALEIANRQVQEANDRKSKFLASMWHELRTPLNSIIGFSEEKSA